MEGRPVCSRSLGHRIRKSWCSPRLHGCTAGPPNAGARQTTETAFRCWLRGWGQGRGGATCSWSGGSTIPSMGAPATARRSGPPLLPWERTHWPPANCGQWMTGSRVPPGEGWTRPAPRRVHKPQTPVSISFAGGFQAIISPSGTRRATRRTTRTLHYTNCVLSTWNCQIRSVCERARPTIRTCSSSYRVWPTDSGCHFLCSNSNNPNQAAPALDGRRWRHGSPAPLSAPADEMPLTTTTTTTIHTTYLSINVPLYACAPRPSRTVVSVSMSVSSSLDNTMYISMYRRHREGGMPSRRPPHLACYSPDSTDRQTCVSPAFRFRHADSQNGCPDPWLVSRSGRGVPAHHGCCCILLAVLNVCQSCVLCSTQPAAASMSARARERERERERCGGGAPKPAWPPDPCKSMQVQIRLRIHHHRIHHRPARSDRGTLPCDPRCRSAGRGASLWLFLFFSFFFFPF